MARKARRRKSPPSADGVRPEEVRGAETTAAPSRWKSGRLLLLAGVVSVVVVAVGVGLALTVLRSGGSKTSASQIQTAPGPQPNPKAYAALYNRATEGTTTLAGVLKLWPKPYQIYSDNQGERCYEWFDRPSVLYNLCFKKGILNSKGLA
jgi:hypothetical protein